MAIRNERDIVDEIAEEILDLPLKGQWLVDMDGVSPYLLSFSLSVGEKNHFKIWIQGEGAIKVDEHGKVDPFNQLIFKGNFISDKKIMLIERYGYKDIPQGEELKFLARLISEGEWQRLSLRGSVEEV